MKKILHSEKPRNAASFIIICAAVGGGMRGNMKIHKVGTVTLGATFVIAGILFLVQSVFSLITYDIIGKIWPAIFIVLGFEILIADRQAGDKVCLYDRTAIILLFILTLFLIFLAFCGGVAENWAGHFNLVY